MAIGVRAHNTIELLEDRLYVVTCGKAGFQNSRNEVSVVQLQVNKTDYRQSPQNIILYSKVPDNALLHSMYQVTDGVSKRSAVLEGSAYTLRAEVLNQDPNYGILVKRCFAFDNSETSLPLVDDRGCRTTKVPNTHMDGLDCNNSDASCCPSFNMTRLLAEPTPRCTPCSGFPTATAPTSSATWRSAPGPVPSLPAISSRNRSIKRFLTQSLIP